MTSKPQLEVGREGQPTRREMIAAGPWRVRREVYGQNCEICDVQIFSVNSAYVRRGDDLSPALYRHQQCHENAVRFNK